MCKPGSASGGSGVTSSGLGLAFAVVAAAGVVSMASAFVGTIITAALITVFSLAAAGTVLVVVILCRTRSVVTWPVRTTLPAAAGRRPAAAPRRVRPARSLPGRPPARPVAGAAARPAVPARQPLAIEAPASAPVGIGLPVGPGDLALVAWPPAAAPANRALGRRLAVDRAVRTALVAPEERDDLLLDADRRPADQLP
jgi:hypothetical protein